MPYIQTIAPKQATGELAEVYRYMDEVGSGRRAGHGQSAATSDVPPSPSAAGPVPNIVQMFSLRAASMRRMIRTWELTLWYGEEPRATKEMLASAVSRLNECHY